MLATDDTSDEDNEDDEKSSTKRPRSISGDDLGDSFSLDEEPQAKRGWVDEVLERKNASESEEEDSSEDSDDVEDDGDSVDEGSDEDNDVSEKATTLKDWEQSDEDDLGTNLEEDEEEERELDEEDAGTVGEKAMEPKENKNLKDKVERKDSKSLDVKKVKTDHAQPSTQPDIPFLIEAPKSLEEFCALVGTCSNADKIVVINRIRASNAIKLAAENRKKMQVWKIIQLYVCSTIFLSFCVCDS